MAAAPAIAALGSQALGATRGCRAEEVVITLQGDGFVVYDVGTPAKVRSQPLGSRQASFVVPVQASGGSYVVALQPTAAQSHVLLRVDASSSPGVPLLDAGARLLLQSPLHSMHQLELPEATTRSATPCSPCTAVVTVDGCVGAASWESSTIQPARGANAQVAQERPRGSVLASGSHGAHLAVATQSAPGHAVEVTFYAATTPEELQRVCSLSVATPRAGSTLRALSLGADATALAWSDGSVTAACVAYQQGEASASSALHLLPTAEPLSAAAASPSPANGVSGNGSSSSSSRKRRADAGAAPHPPPLCPLAVHVLAGGALVLGRLASTHEGVWFQHASYDQRYGCELSGGSVQLEARHAVVSSPSTGAAPQLLLPPGAPNGQAVLLAQGALYLVPLHVGGADLASLVGCMAVQERPKLGAAGVASSGIGGIGGGIGGALPQPPPLSMHAMPGPVGAGVAAAPGATVAHARLDVAALVAGARGGGAATDDGAAVALVSLPESAAAVTASVAPMGAEGVAAAVREARAVLCSSQQPPATGALQRVAAQLLQALQAGGSFVAVEPLLLGALATALAEAALWQPLEGLVSSQPLLSLAHSPRLLPLLAAAEQHDLLSLACWEAKDVPAGAVVAALQHLLQPPAGHDARAARQQQKRAARSAAEATLSCAESALRAGAPPAEAHALLAAARRGAAAVDGFTASQVCLNALAAADADPAEVGPRLRRLSTPQVLRLLAYLAQWVDAYTQSALPLDLAPPPRQLAAPSLQRVLDWSRGLLDAHLTRLATAGDAAAGRLVARLAAAVKQHTSAASKLLPLKGMTEHLVANAPLPEAALAAASAYTVELLDLRVRTGGA